MTAGWAAAVPLVAAADVCVVGSGAAGSTAAVAAARGGASVVFVENALRARLLADGAILDLAVEPVR